MCSEKWFENCLKTLFYLVSGLKYSELISLILIIVLHCNGLSYSLRLQ